MGATEAAVRGGTKGASGVKRLRYCVNNAWLESRTAKFMPVMNPSTGEQLAEAPCCTQDEVDAAVAAAARAFPGWSGTPIPTRIQLMFRFKQLLDAHLDELTTLLATEMGKVLTEARGDVLKAIEVVECACSTHYLMQGDTCMNVSEGYDTVSYREPLGVFAAIAPYNFPAMIPMGWMVPFAITTGNTVVLKAASMVPQTAMRMLELLIEAGMPKGVVNLVTCSRVEADSLLKHPDIRGVTFVGSTSVGLHIYETAAAHGKRVQALTEAKNHALVLDDCVLERSVKGIINSTYGCAGQRCMALPVVCVQESIADRFVELMARYARELKLGPAYLPESQLGPVITAAHRESVQKAVARGLQEGAELVLDGRDVVVPGYEGGYYVGPTILDQVKPGNYRGRRGDLRPRHQHQASQGLRGGPGDHEREPLRQRLLHLHLLRAPRARVRPAHPRRHGGRERGHPGALRHLPLLRPQAVLLRRPAHAGQGRRGLLHRDEVGDLGVVHRGRLPQGRLHLGRNPHPQVAREDDRHGHDQPEFHAADDEGHADLPLERLGGHRRAHRRHRRSARWAPPATR